MNTFPVYEISGSPRELGLAQGKLFKDKILKTIEFYKRISHGDDEANLKAAQYFKGVIGKFNHDYVEEIDAIGESCKIDPLWVYFINARSEILPTKVDDLPFNECSSMYLKKASILGQNWDWGKDAAEHSVVLKIKKNNGNDILMFTEAGIIGKIGLNKNGVGVCLNALSHIKSSRDGVPLHVMLRSVLDSENYEEALLGLLSARAGKAGNVLMADNNGQFFDIEYLGDKHYMYDWNSYKKDWFFHTNHSLKRIPLHKLSKYKSSFSRFLKGKKLLKNACNHDIEVMRDIFMNNEGRWPIYREYEELKRIGLYGTVATIIMDLKEGELKVKVGNADNASFESYRV